VLSRSHLRHAGAAGPRSVAAPPERWNFASEKPAAFGEVTKRDALAPVLLKEHTTDVVRSAQSAGERHRGILIECGTHARLVTERG